MPTVALLIPPETAYDGVRRWAQTASPGLQVQSVRRVAALRTLLAHGAVDLVVAADRLLPWDALHDLRRRFPAVKWISLTTTPSYEWAEAAQLAGAHGFLAVPCLPERLDRLLRWWLPEQSRPQLPAPAALFPHHAEPSEPDLAHPIETAIAYVEAHLDQRLSLDEVSRYVYLSRSHFCRLFQKTLGLSFNDFVQSRRIARAQELLRSTRYPVELIADRLGFSSAAYFSSTFKRWTGVSPRAFREQAGRASRAAPSEATAPSTSADHPREQLSPPARMRRSGVNRLPGPSAETVPDRNRR